MDVASNQWAAKVRWANRTRKGGMTFEDLYEKFKSGGAMWTGSGVGIIAVVATALTKRFLPTYSERKKAALEERAMVVQEVESLRARVAALEERIESMTDEHSVEVAGLRKEVASRELAFVRCRRLLLQHTGIEVDDLGQKVTPMQQELNFGPNATASTNGNKQ